MKQELELPQFKYLGVLGTGGTAQVCKVLTGENKTAALKTILQSDKITQDEFKKLAIREKTLLRDINFPGIVKLYEVQIDDPSYICLEYCSGKTLEQTNKIDDIPTALNILSSIAVNLEFLNIKSIVHADLKPDNIFMPKDISSFSSGRLTFTKLSDFSLGKFYQEDDSVRAGVGTVGYMPPEAIKNNIVTHKSDLFALGVIAYQIFTGNHPFITDDADPLKINSRILEEAPLPLLHFKDNLPEELIKIVSMLLEKDESKRPESAWEVCNMLRKAGAAYPFEKVLNPKYVINAKVGYEENRRFIANHSNRTDTISNKNSDHLRLMLTDNFLKENLVYKNKQFHFKSNPLVSSYFTRHAVNSFMKLSYTEKKSAIELSLQDDKQNLISSLLPHLLNSHTIRRVSNRLAYKFENSDDYSIATQMYLFSGDLLKAENTAYQAAIQFKNENNINAALELLNKVISFGTLLDRKFEMKSLIMVKGDFLKDIGEVDKAEIVYNELIELYKNHTDDELLAETYKDLGDLYKTKKLPLDGIKSLEKALDIYKKLHKELEVSKTYNNLGNIYTVSKNYVTALLYFRRALRIQRKLAAEEEVASTLNNIATIYAMTSKFHKAKNIFKISLSIKKEIGNKGEIARTLNNLGYCYEVLGEAQKAVEILQESLRYNKEIDSKGEILFNLENLTAIMLSTGQLKKSITYLKEGIKLSLELNDQPHISFFNLYMGSVLARMGKIKDAYNSFKQVEEILENIEDDTILAQLYIEKAQLAIYIDNKSDAIELLNKAHLICDELKEKPLLIKVLLLKITISQDSSFIDKAEEIINELKLTKEKSILNALKLNHNLSVNNSYNVQHAYNNLSESVHSSDEHIEQCRLLTTLAKYELSQNNTEQAVASINQSIKLAKTRGLVFDRFHALMLFGEILSKQNEIENCYSVYKEALELAKNIYNQLELAVDKETFQNKEEFLFLVSEIKKLSQIIGQKKSRSKESAL